MINLRNTRVSRLGYYCITILFFFAALLFCFFMYLLENWHYPTWASYTGNLSAGCFTGLVISLISNMRSNKINKIKDALIFIEKQKNSFQLWDKYSVSCQQVNIDHSNFRLIQKETNDYKTTSDNITKDFYMFTREYRSIIDYVQIGSVYCNAEQSVKRLSEITVTDFNELNEIIRDGIYENDYQAALSECEPDVSDFQCEYSRTIFRYIMNASVEVTTIQCFYAALDLCVGKLLQNTSNSII